MGSRERFDPRGILATLERHYVDYVLIGGLARVLRGTDEITDGVDICPSFQAANLNRIWRALGELEASDQADRALSLDQQRLEREPALTLQTPAGPVKLVGVPAGAPNGYVDLRRHATKEDLGDGVRPLVASTADLARMLAALGRPDDGARLRDLRQIIELEADRSQPLLASTPAASRGRRVAPAPRTTR